MLHMKSVHFTGFYHRYELYTLFIIIIENYFAVSSATAMRISEEVLSNLVDKFGENFDTKMNFEIFRSLILIPY